MKAWHITNYDEIYRPKTTKGEDYASVSFAKIPIHYRTDKIEALLEVKNGAEAYGIFILILQKSTDSREITLRGWLVNHQNWPATDLEIAKSIRMKGKKTKVTRALKLLQEFELTEFIDFPYETTDRSRYGTDTDRLPVNRIRNLKEKEIQTEHKGEDSANKQQGGSEMDSVGSSGLGPLDSGSGDSQVRGSLDSGFAGSDDSDIRSGTQAGRGAKGPFSQGSKSIDRERGVEHDYGLFGKDYWLKWQAFLCKIDLSNENPKTLTEDLPELSEHREYVIIKRAKSWFGALFSSEMNAQNKQGRRDRTTVYGNDERPGLIAEVYEALGETGVVQAIQWAQKTKRKAKGPHSLHTPIGYWVKQIQNMIRKPIAKAP